MTLVAVFAAPVFVHAAEAAPAPPRALLISPVAFDFGEIPVGETSPPQEVVVKNVSAAPVDVSGLTVATIAATQADHAADPTQFTLGTVTCAGWLAAGASCTVPFLFSPKEPIGPPVEGETTITVAGQTAAVYLVGTGLEPFLVSPTGFDFGIVPPDTPVGPQYVIVTNESTTTRSVVIADAPPHYPFAFDGQTSDCGLSPLAPSASCRVGYVFYPSTAGSFTETVHLKVNGRTVDVTLVGRAAETQEGVWLTPTALDFGTRFVGIPGRSLGATVSATGTETYTIVSITDPSNAEFQRFFPPSSACRDGTPISAAGLSPQASCGLEYEYTPDAWAAPDTATVTVVLASSAGSTWVLTLTLTGSSRQPFLVTPIGFDFGDVLLGATAPEQAVTVTNVTGTDQDLQQVATFANGPGTQLVVSAVGFQAPPFGGTTTCSSVVLAPGGQCTVGHQFRPTAVGLAEAEPGAALEYTSPPTASPSFGGTQPFWWLYLRGTGYVAWSGSVPVLDTTPPTLRCEATPSFAIGAVGTVSAVVTDTESGPAATTVSTRADTATAGTKAATLTAADNAGNIASVSCPYVVVAPVTTTVPVGELPATGGGDGGLTLAVLVSGVGAALLVLARRRVAST